MIRRSTVFLLILLFALSGPGCKRQTSSPAGKGGAAPATGGPSSAEPPPTGGAKGEPKPGAGAAGGGADWQCGNGKCDQDKGEDCIVCAKDCGKCDGCQRKMDPSCPGCKCEACVCKKLPDCCGSAAKKWAWGEDCVKACKEQCGGCGLK